MNVKTLLSAALIAASSISFGQDPILTSWIMNTTGTASYNVGAGTVNMSDSADVTMVCYNNNNVYVVAEGLPSYEMGPFPMNPNVPAGQDLIWRITRNPQAETGTHTDQPSTGPLGAALNGVALYGISDARSYDPMTGNNSGSGAGVWNTDAWVSEGSTMDANGNGHPQQQGQYHYHANPISLYSDPSTSHSPIIGFAFDGYPIYGPFGYSNPNDSNSPVTRMMSGYQLRSITDRTTLPDGSTSTPPGPPINSTYPLGTYIEDYEYVSGDVDEYGGRLCVTPEYPGGTYAYFMSTDSNGDPAFPYLMGLQYYGVISTADIQSGTNGTIPGSASCGVGTSTNDIDELEAEMYPNPTESTLNIQAEGQNMLVVLDLSGRTILTQSFTDNTVIDLSDLVSGYYLVNITNNDTKATISDMVSVIK